METLVTEVLKTARTHYMHGQLSLQRVNVVELLNWTALYVPRSAAGRSGRKNARKSGSGRRSGPGEKCAEESIGQCHQILPTDQRPRVKISMENKSLLPSSGLRITAWESRKTNCRIFSNRSTASTNHAPKTPEVTAWVKSVQDDNGGPSGKNEIESSLNKGTTVSLFFPHVKDNGAEK